MYRAWQKLVMSRWGKMVQRLNRDRIEGRVGNAILEARIRRIARLRMEECQGRSGWKRRTCGVWGGGGRDKRGGEIVSFGCY